MSTDVVFEHTATFYSLIVGLAVANVLGALAGSAKSRALVRWYWMHTAAAAMLLLIIAQDWWYLLSWDERSSVTHPILVFLLARAGSLFFASSLLVPEAPGAGGGTLDLREHTLRVRRRFFLSLVAFGILDHADTLLKGQDRVAHLGPVYIIYVAAFMVLMLAAALSHTERPAAVATVAMLLVHVAALAGRALGLPV